MRRTEAFFCSRATLRHSFPVPLPCQVSLSELSNPHHRHQKSKGDQKKALEYLNSHELIREGTTIIPFSALKGDGKQEIWSEINNVILK